MSAPEPMDIHDQVQAFADGELSPEEADAFRIHLGTCAQCQADLDDILQLQALGDRLSALEAKEAVQPAPLPRQDASPARAFRPAWSHRRARVATAVALAGSLAAVLAVVVLRSPGGTTGTQAEALALAPTRSLEARLSWDGASAHRPYGVLRSGEERPKELVPLQKLAKLEEAGDLHGLATGHLLRGEREQAAEYLQRAPASPDVDSDKAVVALSKGELEAALILLDGVLEKHPQHPEALWNRALVLRELGLDVLAAEAFDTVVTLREPGWAEEAKERAASLRRNLEGQRGTWDEAGKAGKALATEGTPFPESLARAVPGTARNWFNIAVWAAPSAERVKALLPLARVLDAHYGGDTMERYATRVAGLDFQRRGPLAERFRQVLLGTFDMKGLDAYVREVTASGHTDILLGVLPLTGQLPARLPEYTKAAQALGDPWWTLNAEREAARAEYARGDLAGAEARLLRAVTECRAAKADYRCGQLAYVLSHVYAEEQRLVEAREHALAGLQQARQIQEWTQQSDLLMVLGNVARFRNAFALARAYLGEQAQRDGRCVARRQAQEGLAAMQVFALRPERARAELGKAPACDDVPFYTGGAFVLSDLARLDPRPGDVDALREGVRKLEASSVLRPGERVLLTAAEGRGVLEKDREAGRALLRKAIAESEKLGSEDAAAWKARGYGYSSLILDAGKGGDWAGALALFAEEAGAGAPERCELGVEVHDERTLVVASGPGGELLGHYDASRRSPDFDVTKLVPPTVVVALKPCEHVRVFARYSVHGQAGVLPPDMAWSFHTGAKRAAPAMTAARPLVVHDVEAPASLNLPRLNGWRMTGAPSPRRVELTGAAATPSRLLAELADATEVEIHAHGLVNLGVSDASLLVMSPDRDGRYALTAGEVRRQKLRGAPVVVLGACQAARTAPYLHAPWSLPIAFTEAGARAVIASPIDIPDAEAGPFFERVMERIRSGAPAAVALRDERMRVLSAQPGSWVKTVVVFE